MNIKEKFESFLGGSAWVILKIIMSIFAIYPWIMLDIPTWAMIAGITASILIVYIQPVVWIVTLFFVIKGPQDIFAIIYYVLMTINFIPLLINIAAMISNIFSKNK